MGIPAVPFSGSAILAFGAAISITVPLFILNAMRFVPLGQIVGGYLDCCVLRFGQKVQLEVKCPEIFVGCHIRGIRISNSVSRHPGIRLVDVR